MGPRPSSTSLEPGVLKAPTGVRGLDEITDGGLPAGRATLIAGAAGSGKSMLALEFLVRGATLFDEPGVLISFEESAADITANAVSLGFDLDGLQSSRALMIDSLAGTTEELVASGEFDLDGLFIRLAYAIEQTGAKRVVLDTIELLFANLPDERTVRREFGRLLRWLKDRGLSVIVTAERGATALTRHGIEEFVSDCVLVLDHRVDDQVSTRRLRIAKYRGSQHGTNEFPFLITGTGFAVMPMRTHHVQPPASDERIGLGIAKLDEMLGGGIFRGSTTMLSGSAGTGKTSICAASALAAVERGDRVVFVSLEETQTQIVRNMRSIGLDLEPSLASGQLTMSYLRPGAMGLEQHLAALHGLIDENSANFVIVDAIGSLARGVSANASSALIARDIDLMRARGVTALFTTLTEDDHQTTEVDASSLVDAWLLLRNTESDGERNRLLYIIKNRGSAHSNQVREFVISAEGPDLVDIVVGPAGVLTGSRRREYAGQLLRQEASRTTEIARLNAQLEARRAEIHGQIQVLQHQLDSEVAQTAHRTASLTDDDAATQRDRTTLADLRSAAERSS